MRSTSFAADGVLERTHLQAASTKGNGGEVFAHDGDATALVAINDAKTAPFPSTSTCCGDRSGAPGSPPGLTMPGRQETCLDLGFLSGGGERNRTAVQGFAGPSREIACSQVRPHHCRSEHVFVVRISPQGSAIIRNFVSSRVLRVSWPFSLSLPAGTTRPARGWEHGVSRKQSNGRYRARYRGPDGRTLSKTFDRKWDADRFLALTIADMSRAAWVDPARVRMRFGVWAEEWLAMSVDLRASTRSTYERELRSGLLPTFEGVPLASITPEVVRRWIAAQSAAGVSATQANKRFRILRRILNVAVETDHLVKNPCKGIRAPEIPHQEMQFLTAPQVRDLAEAMPDWCRVWVYFAAETGLRWGEMLGVRRRDLDFLRRKVHVVQQITEVQSVIQPPSRPKTKAGKRTVDLSPFLAELLMDQLDWAQPGPSGLVFVNTVGNTPHASSFYSGVWSKAKRKAGLELRWHDLRHTAVALAVEQGAHALAIKERLGHSTIEVTLDRYGHLFPQLGEAIAVGLDVTFRAVQHAPSSVAPVDALAAPRPRRRA